MIDKPSESSFPRGLKLMPGTVSNKSGEVFGSRPEHWDALDAGTRHSFAKTNFSHLRITEPGEIAPQAPDPVDPPPKLEPPYEMSAEVEEIFYKTVAELKRWGLAEEADAFTVASYAEVSAELARLLVEIRDAKTTVRGSRGQEVVNPLLRRRDRLLDRQAHLANQLGLTAAARGRLARGGWTPPAKGRSGSGSHLFDGSNVRPQRSLYEDDD
jgi:P27 family predicted phage terminase small subunit